VNRATRPRATRAAGDLARRYRAFEARTAQYRALGYDRVAAARFVAAAAGRLRGPALDVGTGKGLLALELARLSLDVVSVDVDGAELPLASHLAREAGVGERVRFLHRDAARLPFRDGHFGCAAMMDVLHHIDDPRPVLAEMARTVKVGGVVVVADFSREGFRLVARVHRAEGRVHPESGVTVEHARALLEQGGLDCMVQVEGHLHEVAIMVKRRRRRPRPHARSGEEVGGGATLPGTPPSKTPARRLLRGDRASAAGRAADPGRRR
jgi:ubiquinone/menaquinone biosynthesis C-methylase UbiE